MRRAATVGVILSIILSAASAEAAVPRWKRKLDKLTRNRSVSVRIVRGDRVLVDKRSSWKRTPASNEKLLLSMALLDRLGPDERFATTARVEPTPAPLVDAGQPNIDNGVLHSDLYVNGHGDPTLTTSHSPYARALSVAPTKIGDLAHAIKDAGVRRIRGRVVGVVGYFRHDWDAPGWKPEFPREEVALPSALTLNGNVRHERFIDNPEWQFARALTKKLEALSVKVSGAPRAGRLPDATTRLASISSRPLRALLGHMNRKSSNFFAEVFGKALAVQAGHRPGTIAGGARVLRRWTARRGVRIRAYDGSGLSYADRVSPRGIVKLLGRAERAGWGDDLFHSLPKGGWGTLEDRLTDVRLRAKTGTLDDISSLSGWLWLRRSDRWGRFSIMINGFPTWKAKALEDGIVRLVTRHF